MKNTDMLNTLQQAAYRIAGDRAEQYFPTSEFARTTGMLCLSEAQIERMLDGETGFHRQGSAGWSFDMGEVRRAVVRAKLNVEWEAMDRAIAAREAEEARPAARFPGKTLEEFEANERALAELHDAFVKATTRHARPAWISNPLPQVPEEVKEAVRAASARSLAQADFLRGASRGPSTPPQVSEELQARLGRARNTANESGGVPFYKQDAIRELIDHQSRLRRLERFMETPKFHKLGRQNAGLVANKRDAMRYYLRVLREHAERLFPMFACTFQEGVEEGVISPIKVPLGAADNFDPQLTVTGRRGGKSNTLDFLFSRKTREELETNERLRASVDLSLAQGKDWGSSGVMSCVQTDIPGTFRIVPVGSPFPSPKGEVIPNWWVGYPEPPEPEEFPEEAKEALEGHIGLLNSFREHQGMEQFESLNRILEQSLMEAQETLATEESKEALERFEGFVKAMQSDYPSTMARGPRSNVTGEEKAKMVEFLRDLLRQSIDVPSDEEGKKEVDALTKACGLHGRPRSSATMEVDSRLGNTPVMWSHTKQEIMDIVSKLATRRDNWKDRLARKEEEVAALRHELAALRSSIPAKVEAGRTDLQQALDANSRLLHILECAANGLTLYTTPDSEEYKMLRGMITGGKCLVLQKMRHAVRSVVYHVGLPDVSWGAPASAEFTLAVEEREVTAKTGAALEEEAAP